MRTGITNFSLDYGKCPRWLFERMTKLSRIIGIAIIEEFGAEEFLRRLADPVWFQSLICVIGFDWNSSGGTTTGLAALKEAFRGLEKKFGVFICGGKGKTSRKTPDEILNWGGKIGFDQNIINRLIFASKASAKVDSSLIQDGFQIYHHNFIFAFTKSNQINWTVIQQGMNIAWQKARRYHWFGDLSFSDFINEPHQGIASQIKLSKILNLTAKESEKNREISVELANNPSEIRSIIKISENSFFATKDRFFKVLDLSDKDFYTHPVINEKIDFSSPYLKKSLEKIFIQKPKTFQNLLMIKGVGAKTIRALSLIGEIIYGAKPSYEDPARYTFAHGGKDNVPYPVDRKTYDKTIEIMSRAIRHSFELSLREKDIILRGINRE